MRHEVLKQFPWSPNGFDVEILNPGDKRNFGAAHGGLAMEGFVSGDAEVVEPAPEPFVELAVEEIATDEPKFEVEPEAQAEPAVPEATPESPTIVEPAPEPVRQPRKRK